MRILTPAEAARRDRDRQDAFWSSAAQAVDDGAFVAETGRGRERFRFNPAQPVSDVRAEFRGFNGDRWTVRFRDGRGTVDTNDLYGNGVIPERFWDQFPVTADLEWLGRARPAAAPAALATAVRPDGSAVLSPADLIEVLAALEHATGSLVDRAGQCCDDCGTHPAGACESHVDDLDQADALRAVAARLGEGAPVPAADGAAAAAVVAALDAALTASAQLAAVRAVMDWALNSRHSDSSVALDKIGRILAGGAS